MSDEIAVRFNRAELMLISAALATQSDDESKILAIEIYKALNEEAVEEAPAEVVAPPPPAPKKAPGPDEDFVLRSGPEQASFSDGSVVLRQRMSLHPIFGKINTAILQPDVFRSIFAVETTIAECESRLRNPEFLNQSPDGVPGDVTARVRSQQAGARTLPTEAK